MVSNDIPGPSRQASEGAAPSISLDNVSINVDQPDEGAHSEAPSEELRTVMVGS